MLHLTQSALSRQLMQMEAELGVQRFHCSRYHIALTNKGILLRQRAGWGPAGAAADAAAFNLILNAANMVRCGVGTALGFDLNLAFDGLRFLPLFPEMETGTVLV